MGRTKNTAKILRALEIQASASSSSSSSSDDDVSDGGDRHASIGSAELSIYGFDGVPNAQNADEIQERTQVPGSSEKGNEGEGSRSRASSAGEMNDNCVEESSDVASSGSRKRGYA
ncbi:hypothetical protein DVH05_001034 [Phytophthora capsici]|nr:hypothetical protein DVH05_001034 [Phytophthora capsici]